jgi:hypothetical protein
MEAQTAMQMAQNAAPQLAKGAVEG